MLAGAYKNAVAVLRDRMEPQGEDLGSLLNPIIHDNARFTVDIRPAPIGGNSLPGGGVGPAEVGVQLLGRGVSGNV